ncbi:adhesion G-protein coupled receptor F3 [Clinocottus analis]|uniref:adhesion G-protein coupled receptor F3 n=1 Tax=Clinocottus analis TaxID=304258 RepID=UPI0035BF2671
MSVQSNITLEADAILSLFNTTDLQVSGSTSVPISDIELLSDCLLIGDETNCSCSPGYIWSNPVCYNYNCCRETTCLQNVSDITPLCIAKVDGVVTIEAPEFPVCYKSVPVMNCTMDEATDRAGWNLTTDRGRFEIDTGSVAKVNMCDSVEHKSCIELRLEKVTGIWSGTYECGFASGSIRHTAKIELKVIILPDDITLKINPLAVDCFGSTSADIVPVEVTATILDSDETFDVWLDYMTTQINDPPPTNKDTVVNITCAEGLVGYKSRTCDGTAWQPVFYYCINQQLNKVVIQAEDFRKGLNTTHEMALHIFAGLKNSSTIASDPYEYMADINVSITCNAHTDLITTGSNILNKSWVVVNQSVLHDMSANYLQSMEGLVENVQVNSSTKDILNNQNIKLKFCSSRDCNVSLFGIDVNMNLTTGILKTIAMKNLMDKLRNNFLETESTSLLLSATIQDNDDKDLQIRIQFPLEKLNFTKPHCVFWNTTMQDWSDEGCEVVKPKNDNQTFCKCDHLTSFSVLMAKEDISNESLDIITYVGLGVSICSLLIFLTVELLVWSAVVKSNLAHFRHTALVNIATFLLLGDICFLASPKGISETLCLTMTVCKHLFFLAMFGWMMCLSVMLVHQLIFVFSPLRKKVFMFLSSIVGYVCPILIVGSSYTYYRYTYKPYFDKDTCWLVYERLLVGSIHSFLLPIGTVILTNLFSMMVVIITVVKSSTPEGSKADDKETAKGVIKLVVFLTPIFGITWIIGFALLLLNKNNPMFTAANYSFTILNSFQGLFLLIIGCFAEPKIMEMETAAHMFAAPLEANDSQSTLCLIQLLDF